jgi:hypothetical protein
MTLAVETRVAVRHCITSRRNREVIGSPSTTATPSSGCAPLARHDAAAGDDEPPDALALAQARPSSCRSRCTTVTPSSPPSRPARCARWSTASRSTPPPSCRPATAPRSSVCCATSCVSRRPDGRVELAFRKPDPSGRTSWVTDGPELLRRLAALIPPRRVHGVKYHAVFSSAHKLRPRIAAALAPDHPEPDDSARPTRPSRLCWSALLERVFGAQITACPECGDRLRVLAFITDPDVTTNILNHLGITSEPFAFAPARAPPPPFDDFA